jgi:hypothetical protein
MQDTIRCKLNPESYILNFEFPDQLLFLDTPPCRREFA